MLSSKFCAFAICVVCLLFISCSDDPVGVVFGPDNSLIDTVWDGKIVSIEPQENLQPGTELLCSVEDVEFQGVVSPLGNIVCVVPEVEFGRRMLQVRGAGISQEFRLHVVQVETNQDPVSTVSKYVDRLIQAHTEMGQPDVRGLVYSNNYYQLLAQVRIFQDLIDSAEDESVQRLGTMIERNPQLFDLSAIVGERLGTKRFDFEGRGVNETFALESQDVIHKVSTTDAHMALLSNDIENVSFIAKWAFKTGAMANGIFLRALSQHINKRPMVVSGLAEVKAKADFGILNGRATRCVFYGSMRNLSPSDKNTTLAGKLLASSLSRFSSLWELIRSNFQGLEGNVFDPFNVGFVPTTYSDGPIEADIVKVLRALQDSVSTELKVDQNKAWLNISDYAFRKKFLSGRELHLECELQIDNETTVLDTIAVYVRTYELVDSIVPLEFVAIPPGTFLMGSENGELDERPVHEVVISRGFEMSVYPITTEQYYKMVDDSEYEDEVAFYSGATPNSFYSFGHWNYRHVTTFLNNRNDGYIYRLPTEAEWEYACRAGAATTYFWGDDYEAGTEYLGGYKPQNELPNSFGLRGMIGGILEIVSDSYSPNFYSGGDMVDPHNPHGPEVQRGRSCSARDHEEVWNIWGGIRLVRVPK